MIAENLQIVRQQIARAAERCGRHPSDIHLIAVSKRKPAATIVEAFRAGQRDFGESYVQEAAEKCEILRLELGEEFSQLRFHMVGGLQSNKAKSAVAHFSMVQSVDRRSLATELAKSADSLGRVLPVLVQVNVSGEEQKSGVAPDSALDFCRSVSGSPHLKLKGLMAIGTWLAPGEDQELRRSEFKSLAVIRERVQQELSIELPELSMGMSGDFEIAIEEGATMVRVGTGIFGARE